ncbi:MAG: hypothetical protein H8D05_01705 [FCB group bacterium]|nr:hypothetical protein [FCB group bacterium]
MTQINSIKVTCPNCSRKQRVTVFSSINVSLDPKLRTDLFDGKINVINCTACDYAAFLGSPLLYHDMKRGFCIQFYPPQAIEDAKFIDAFQPSYPVQYRNMPEKKFGYGAKPHLVFDMNDLVFCVMFYEKLLSGTE